MISNSFHSSAKSHSISSAGSLAKAERHNSRGYFSFYYDKSKISDLVGTADSLAADVENAINQTFKEHVTAYNEKQKRADRKIQTSAFEHFAQNKKLDLAVESILQIGDKEFWGQFRDERIVTRNGRELVLKSFPGEVKRVMDDIFKKQISAYENIYQTHGEIIAAKICTAYDEAAAVATKSEQEHPDFQEIYKAASKERVSKITELSPDEQADFAEYSEARDTMAAIVNLKLRERISANHMHIKVVGATAHYDEFSPHAHSISLCYADGYSKGLSSRVAKSVVLNRWALEVIQERLNEIAKEEISKHPEIFGDEKVKPKEKGRNHDFTTEQIRRQNLAALEDRIEAAEASERSAREKAFEAQKNASEAENRANRAAIRFNHLVGQQMAAEERIRDLTSAIQSIEEYDLEADGVNATLSNTESMIDDMKEMMSLASPLKRKRAEEIFERYAAKVREQIKWIKGVLVRLFGFEKVTRMPEPERRAPSLDARIKSAAARVKDTSRKDVDEPHW